MSSTTRVAAYPQVQAISEVVPGFEFSAWYGLFGPANMEPALKEKFASAAKAAAGSPAMRERLTSEGLVPMDLGPAAFDAFVRSEIERWGKVVAATGAKPA